MQTTPPTDAELEAYIHLQRPPEPVPSRSAFRTAPLRLTAEEAEATAQ